MHRILTIHFLRKEVPDKNTRVFFDLTGKHFLRKAGLLSSYQYLKKSLII